jgi:hypothetical protein
MGTDGGAVILITAISQTQPSPVLARISPYILVLGSIALSLIYIVEHA